MKRFHVSITVEDLEKSVHFYSVLFGAPPDVRRSDYAKWMLEDPRINFAIDARGRAPGVDHLGIEVEGLDQLGEVTDRLVAAQGATVRQNDATCCYARSDKTWVWDPAGVAWATFNHHGAATVYGEDTLQRMLEEGEEKCA